MAHAPAYIDDFDHRDLLHGQVPLIHSCGVRTEENERARSRGERVEPLPAPGE
jgi:hypothetical protein